MRGRARLRKKTGRITHRDRRAVRQLPDGLRALAAASRRWQADIEGLVAAYAILGKTFRTTLDDAARQLREAFATETK